MGELVPIWVRQAHDRRSEPTPHASDARTGPRPDARTHSAPESRTTDSPARADAIGATAAAADPHCVTGDEATDRSSRDP